MNRGLNVASAEHLKTFYVNSLPTATPLGCRGEKDEDSKGKMDAT